MASVADDHSPNRHAWARLKLADHQLSPWVPAKEKIRALARAGKLRGRFVDEGVMPEPPSAAEITVLASGGLGAPFNGVGRLVLRRLRR